ncbi:hypothetical protein CU048_02940 [Beijerinckiaceae bacterium]|nr:hypothetical protein CU048_02940 [Beijerinckiaceae bacterium]
MKEIMSISGNNNRSAPKATDSEAQSAADSRKTAERARLAEALRANLRRRKAQKLDRGKQAGDDGEASTMQGGVARK